MFDQIGENVYAKERYHNNKYVFQNKKRQTYQSPFHGFFVSRVGDTKLFDSP